MNLVLFLLVLCGILFHAGWRAPPHPLRHRSRAAFVVAVALTLFAGYFAWREHRSLQELAALIEPVPDVEDVMYIPTGEELGAIATVLAAMPRGRYRGPASEDPAADARELRQMESRYWRIDTGMTVQEVLAFYETPGRLGAWQIAERDDPMLLLHRGEESMMIWVQDGWGVRKVWYIYR